MLKQFIAIGLMLINIAFAQNVAHLQIIHNIPDPEGEKLDIYLDGKLFIDDFEFRTATKFLDFPADRPVNIGVALANSQSDRDIIKSFALELRGGQSYIAILSGVLDPEKFAANPDSLDISFNLYSRDNARQRSLLPGLITFAWHQGVTDLPAVDIVARTKVGLPSRFDIPIANNFFFGEVTDFLDYPAREAEFRIIQSDNPAHVLARFEVDFRQFTGKSLFFFLSGFLYSTRNENGPALGLFAALPDGQILDFSQPALAQLQIIHNVADPAGKKFDIYLDGKLFIDDFAFQTATPNMEFSTDRTYKLGLAPANSQSNRDIFKSFTLEMHSGLSYVAVLDGVLNPENFAPNPDSLDIAVNLFSKGLLDEVGFPPTTSDSFKVALHHGSTDFPTVSVVALNSLPLAGTFKTPLAYSLSYGETTNYLPLIPQEYKFLFFAYANPTHLLVSFTVNLQPFTKQSAVLFLSGFLNPDSNQNGPSLTLLAAFPDGKVVNVSDETNSSTGVDFVTDIEKRKQISHSFALFQNYPNPFNPGTTIQFTIPQNEYVQLSVYDLNGKHITTLIDGRMPAGEHRVYFDATSLASGIYFYRLQAGSYSAIKRMILLK